MNAERPRHRADSGAGIDAAASGFDAPRVLRQHVSAIVQLRQRRDAAERLPPLACGHRDPRACAAEPVGLSTYGLSAAQMHAEVRRRRADGWQNWELRARFASPVEVAA